MVRYQIQPQVKSRRIAFGNGLLCLLWCVFAVVMIPAIASGQQAISIETSAAAAAIEARAESSSTKSSPTNSSSIGGPSTKSIEQESISFSGTVAATSKYSFDVQTDTETIRCEFNDETEFAIRLRGPWFDFENQKVFVSGAMQLDGKPERVGFDLPEGPMYLLMQFRSRKHLERTMSEQPTLEQPMRVNFYLLSPDYIEPNEPAPDNLMMAGKISVSGENHDQVILEIEEQSYPIQLGFKSATLRGRSINDLAIGKTKVMVSGEVKPDGGILASTVLFQPF
jgi:hypothetical protein